jgi:hypothetical protein
VRKAENNLMEPYGLVLGNSEVKPRVKLGLKAGESSFCLKQLMKRNFNK